MWWVILVKGMAADLPNIGRSIFFMIMLKVKCKIILGQFYAKNSYGPKLEQSVWAVGPQPRPKYFYEIF